MAGARVNVPAQVKPLIDKTVADQIAAVQARMRNDPTLEQNARAQWAKSLPLDSAAGHRRALDRCRRCGWSCKPTRAIAAQPRVDASR